MSDLWAAIDTRRHCPRILVTNSGREPLVKALMSGPPQHRRALPTFLEALALWEGRPVRAALVVGKQGGCDTSLYHEFFADPDHTPMYSIDYVSSPEEMKRAYRDQLGGMGRFQDLKQLLIWEVAR
jgi:hypothetical protein